MGGSDLLMNYLVRTVVFICGEREGKGGLGSIGRRKFDVYKKKHSSNVTKVDLSLLDDSGVPCVSNINTL